VWVMPKPHPIIIWHNPHKIVILDGHHRLHAEIKKGQAYIPAYHLNSEGKPL